MIDILSIRDKLKTLLKELGEAALIYEAAGYRSNELWEAWKHIIKTMNDVTNELSASELLDRK